MELGNLKPASDVLPIFVATRERPPRITGYCGTGFLVARGLLVTCWHCVSASLERGQSYAVARLSESGDYYIHPLSNVGRDERGSDLATANVDLEPQFELHLGSESVTDYGQDVWTFGYPLTGLELFNGERRFKLNARYIEGYTMRSFYYDHPTFGRTASFELDMPTPQGLSGAPLVKRPSREIIGVIYGTHEVATIDQFAAIDPTTGERTPEIQRFVSFGLAHFTESLHRLSGLATGGQALLDIARNAGPTQ